MRSGSRFRVGKTQLIRNWGVYGKQNSGLTQRMTAERADALWVLRVHESNREAQAYEQVVAAKFGLPQTVFHVGRSHIMFEQADVDQIFRNLAPQTDRAVWCLAAHGRDIESPLYRPWIPTGH